MSYIFISYNQEDAAFVALLRSKIEQTGVDTWLDKRMLQPGQDWSQEIDEAITSAYAVLVIMSPEAKASEYVTYEWSFAIGAGLRVIPVLYKKTDPHPRLARLHFLNFTDPSAQPWDELLAAVNSAVGDLRGIRLPRNAPAHVRDAVLALNSSNRAEWNEAIRILANTEHPSGREALLSALHHHAQQVRWAAANTLNGEPAALPTLAEIALDTTVGTNMRDRTRVLHGYGERAVTLLLELVRDQRTDAVEIANTLQTFPSSELKPHLKPLLEDADPRARRVAFQAFPFDGEVDDQGALNELLLKALHDTDGEVRVVATRQIVSSTLMGNKETCERILYTIFRDEYKPVRAQAFESITGAYHVNKASPIVGILAKLARDEHFYTAVSAYRTLKQIESRSANFMKWEAEKVLDRLTQRKAPNEAFAQLGIGTIYTWKPDHFPRNEVLIDDSLQVVLAVDAEHLEVGELRENAESNEYEVVSRRDDITTRSVEYRFEPTGFVLPDENHPSFLIDPPSAPATQTQPTAVPTPTQPKTTTVVLGNLRDTLVSVLWLGFKGGLQSLFAAVFIVMAVECFRTGVIHNPYTDKTESGYGPGAFGLVVGLCLAYFGLRNLVLIFVTLGKFLMRPKETRP